MIQKQTDHSYSVNYKSGIFNKIIALLLLSGCCFAQPKDSLTAVQLKKLSLEALLDINITSVSKRAEKLNEAASAVQVISNEDIRRSGAVTLADALKLAVNLQVAQINSSQWAVSARGFNNALANKLLVLIDGRVVYTPMYAGVFWDVQNLLLEDVDRIEVISGPGGTLWGANAVNGVINVITKSSHDTQGAFAEAGYGTHMRGIGSVRYGGKINEKISYRAYATGFRLGSTIDTLGAKAHDDWHMIQGGFRSDYEVSDKDRVSLQGNIYYGRPDPDGMTAAAVIARGDNLVARWNRTISDKSDFQLQAFFDHTLRDFRNEFSENLKTYDIDWQHRFQFGTAHVVTYGMGFRVMDHDVANLELFGFFPGEETLYLYNGFVQYEAMAVPDRLKLTIGSKLEYNSYTKYQYQPNARITWTPANRQTIWGAVSRAVRNPSRIDRDFRASAAPDLHIIMGSKDFLSEIMVAYETGWRFHTADNKMSLSLSAFYNVYDQIRSAEPGPPPGGIPIVFGNGVEGETYGAEFFANYRPSEWLRFRGGYTYLEKELRIKPGSDDLNQATAESNDPSHQFLLQSDVDINDFELGTVLRFVDHLPDPEVDAYWGLDLRLGWNVNDFLELSLVGKNLIEKEHTEFIASTPERLIERSIYGKVTCRF